MRVAIQAPIPLLEEYCTLTNYQVCKALLILDNPIYREFYTQRKALGDYTVLDCSISNPREAVSSDSLMEAVRVLRPNLVVVPDYDVNYLRTVDSSVHFLRIYSKELKQLGVDSLGMVQGATLKQYRLCYSNLFGLVEAIGLPRTMEVKVGRARFLREIQTTKPVHIFGLQNSPEKELDSLLDLENVFGIVSSLPFRLGLQCRLLEEYRPEPPELDYLSTRNPYPEFTRDNIKDLIAQASDW